VTAINPKFGNLIGGDLVTIRGTGFGTDYLQAEVFIDGV